MPLKVDKPQLSAGADIEKIIENLAKENAELKLKINEQSKVLDELTRLKADSSDYFARLQKSVARENSLVLELDEAKKEIKELAEIRNYLPSRAEMQALHEEMKICSEAVETLPGWWLWLRNSATIPVILLVGISIAVGVKVVEFKNQINETDTQMRESFGVISQKLDNLNR